MDFKIEEIKNNNKKIYNYDIKKLLKKDTVNFSEARFVLETLGNEVSQENFDFFVLFIKYRKFNIKKYIINNKNNFFRIKSKFKLLKTKQIIGVYLYYNKEIFLLGHSLSLSNMLKELFLKLRYINQERRIKFIKQNPELSKNNEQIYLIYKENILKIKNKKFYNEKKDYFESNIDAYEVSLKQMIGICERFDLNNKLLNKIKKELTIIQNRRNKKEYEEIKNKLKIEFINFGEI
mgnify:CR=1 FL=1